MKFPPALINALLVVVIFLGAVNLLVPMFAKLFGIPGVESDPLISLLFGGVAGALLGVKGRNGKDPE